MSGDLSTYSGLKDALGEYSGRAGNATVVANYPLFVRRAHVVIMRDLDIPQLHETTDLTINAERIAIPTGYLATKRLFIDADYDNPVLPTSQELRVREAVTQSAGRPRVFAREGGYLAFGPIPDASYTGKLLYKKALTFFANDAATNGILTDHPFLYLYGALAELARFDKADEDEARFEAMFRAEMSSVEIAERNNAMDGGALRMIASGGVA